MGIAVFLLSVPITGFIAVAQGNAEFAFWHALFSASGIAVSLTGIKPLKYCYCLKFLNY